MIYLANQKHYETDNKSSCLCAPCDNRHRYMETIHKGDFFLNNVGSNMIKAISIAKDNCHELGTPEGLPSPPQGWKPGEGVYQVPVDYYEFSSPIKFDGGHGPKYVQPINQDNAKNFLEKSLKQEQLPEVQNILNEALEMAKSKTNNNYTDDVGLLKSAKNVIFHGAPSELTVKIAKQLRLSCNLLLHGAPGTGKTYLAKQIASFIVSNDKTDNIDSLTSEEQDRIGFVQFYPGYDYSNFMEGYKPIKGSNGSLGFELKDGIFKKFVNKAQKDDKDNFVFIIDEINRGNISSIFW